MVYDLVSKVTGRKSSQSVEISDCSLYETRIQEVRVYNPFEKDAVFSIEVESPTTKDGKPTTPCFFTTSSRVHVQSKKTMKITICYLPLTFRVHSAKLVLFDERVGEL